MGRGSNEVISPYPLLLTVSHDHHKPELQRTDTMILQLPQTSSHLDRQTSSPRPKGRGKWTSIGKETAVKKESSGVRSARELLRTMAEVHCVFAEVGTCNHMCVTWCHLCVTCVSLCVTCVSLCVTCVSHGVTCVSHVCHMVSGEL